MIYLKTKALKIYSFALFTLFLFFSFLHESYDFEDKN